jgi:hypothetical protein
MRVINDRTNNTNGVTDRATTTLARMDRADLARRCRTHLATAANRRGDLLQSHRYVRRRDGSAWKTASFCHRPSLPIANPHCHFKSGADSHGRPVSPYSHVHSGRSRGYKYPQSTLRRVRWPTVRKITLPDSNSPQDHSQPAHAPPTCRVVLLWKMSRPLSPTASPSGSVSTQAIRKAFATAANGPADGRSRSLTKTDLPLRGYLTRFLLLRAFLK